MADVLLIVVLFAPVDSVVISESVLSAIDETVREAHPHEAGGFLGCRRRGGRLYATGHVALDNEATDARRRYRTTVDDRVMPEPRVFYHSHTSPASPADLTRLDRRSIPERFAMVVFAPRGEPSSYRVFKRGLLHWRELSVGIGPSDGRTDPDPAPRLPPAGKF